MIQIIPSIAIQNGKVLRLREGNYLANHAYTESPVDLAREFENAGAQVLHLVDLDGAKKGKPVNYHVLEAIAGHTNLKIDFTGGIHTDGDISKAYEYGASYITAASIAVTQPELFSGWIVSYGREKITLGADCRNHKVEIRGWQKKTDIDIMDHIQTFYNVGLKYVKTTDIVKEGGLQGPSIYLYKDIIKNFPGIQVLASGGVRSIDDIKELNEAGVFAVIIGKAFYEGRITLEELSEYLSDVGLD